MERLKDLYKTENIAILIHQEEELLLLLDNRHVKHEKTNIAFLNGFKFKTTCEQLDKEIVAKLVREKYVPFYETDIQEIINQDDHFRVVLVPHLTLHFGEFIINKEV